MARIIVTLVWLCSLACLPGCLFRIGLGNLSFGAILRSPPGEMRAGPSVSGIVVDSQEIDFELASDLTYTGTTAVRRTLVTPAGVLGGQQSAMTFDPRTQSLELLEAYVVSPGGDRVEVTGDNVFTRPSQSAQETPGFVNTLTTTVVFPQLRVGSQTYVKWRFVERGTPSLGFNYVYQPDFTLPHKSVTIRLSCPEGVDLKFRERGGFDVVESRRGDREEITARLSDYLGGSPENKMPDPKDLAPVFVATTLNGWEEIGALFHKHAEPRIEVTPEIQELANRLAGDKEGLDAARTLYRWVCRNIHYVAVYLDSMDSWVPHRASDVLQRGYGDCKDHFVLLASLLRARGIRADAVLIDSRLSFNPLPLWTPLQFDHCMAFLPDLGVYANPTNPYADLGVLETSLSGKFVVHATEAGARGKTPWGKNTENRYEVSHEVEILKTGTVRGKTTYGLMGRPAQLFRSVLGNAAEASAVANDLLLRTPEGGAGSLTSTDPTNLDIPLHCEGHPLVPH